MKRKDRWVADRIRKEKLHKERFWRLFFTPSLQCMLETYEAASARFLEGMARQEDDSAIEEKASD